MDLFWNKCQGDVWCRLSTVNLAHSHFDNMVGVYIIWHGGPQPATVKVGRGNIRDELQAQRIDAHVQAFANLGLFVTWASVPEQQAAGVQVFLVQKLNPKVPVDNAAPAAPVSATVPW